MIDNKTLFRCQVLLETAELALTHDGKYIDLSDIPVEAVDILISIMGVNEAAKLIITKHTTLTKTLIDVVKKNYPDKLEYIQKLLVLQ